MSKAGAENRVRDGEWLGWKGGVRGELGKF